MCHEKYSFLPLDAASASGGVRRNNDKSGEEGKLVVLMRDYIVHMTFFDISVLLLVQRRLSQQCYSTCYLTVSNMPKNCLIHTLDLINFDIICILESSFAKNLILTAWK